MRCRHGGDGYGLRSYTRSSTITVTYIALPALLLAVLALGCTTQVCTDDARTGLRVVIEGAEADDSVSAEAVAIGETEEHSEELDCVRSNGRHECSGLVERPGTFLVTVTLNGTIEAQTVTLQDDGCHVVPQTVPFFTE